MFYKRFVTSLLCMLFVGLSSILYITYKYDPANIHNDKLTNKAVDIMLSGKHVLGLTNYDERRLRKTFIFKDSSEVKTCILGSSRAMSIRSKKDGVRNYSVSGAVLEDILGLWNVVDENKNYNKIVIGIDAWIFNDNSGENRWKTLNKDYVKAVNKLGINKSFSNEVDLEKYWQMISLDYLKASIKVMRNKARNSNIEGIDRLGVDAVLLLKDGSIDYGKGRNSISMHEVDKEVKSYLKGDVYHLKGYDKLDENRLNIFSAFIRKLKTDNKEVILFLTPYHPSVYEYFKQNYKYKMVLETERFICGLGNTNNVKIIGSFNPDVCGVSEEDFMDAMHLKNKTVDKLFEKVI